MGQELLTTFAAELEEFALKPGEGGVFDIYINGQLVFSRKEKRRFPDIRELKQLVRDHIAPDKPLGHSDNYVNA